MDTISSMQEIRGILKNFVFSLEVEDCYHEERLSLNSYRILH